MLLDERRSLVANIEAESLNFKESTAFFIAALFEKETFICCFKLRN
jgi:hypothetical protein